MTPREVFELAISLEFEKLSQERFGHRDYILEH